METIWKINLKITLTLLFLIVSISIAFAAAPVLNSVVGGAQEPDPHRQEGEPAVGPS